MTTRGTKTREFSSLNDPANVEEIFENKYRIAMEGQTDVDLFNDYLYVDASIKEIVIFVPVGGCEKVLSKVDNWRRDNLMAYGILDRDALLSDAHAAMRDVLLEHDEARFRQGIVAHERFQYIHVLTGWEIENYLISDIELLEDVLKIWRRKGLADDDAQGIENTLSIIIEKLIPIMASWFVAADLGIDRFKNVKHTGIADRDSARTEACRHICNELQHKDSTRNSTEVTEKTDREMRDFEARIDRFAQGHRHASRAWYRNIIKIVAGKEFIDLLCEQPHYNLRSQRDAFQRVLAREVARSRRSIREIDELFFAWCRVRVGEVW